MNGVIASVKPAAAISEANVSRNARIVTPRKGARIKGMGWKVGEGWKVGRFGRLRSRGSRDPTIGGDVTVGRVVGPSDPLGRVGLEGVEIL